MHVFIHQYDICFPSNYSTQYNNFEKAMLGTGVISKFFRVSVLVYSTFSTNTNCVWEGVIIPPCVIGICQNLVDVEPTICLLYGCFPKCWYPTTMGFPTKNDHFGVFGGVPLFTHITWRCPCHDAPWHEWPKATLLQLWPSQSSSLPQSHSSFVIFEIESKWWCVLRLPYSLSW